MKKFLVITVVCVLVLSLFSCLSTPKPDPVISVQTTTEDELDKVVVVDWTDRALGEVQAPTWLKNMRRGN